MEARPKLDFNNIENAFVNKTDAELRSAYWLFKAINSNVLVRISPFLVNLAFKLHLPVKWLIKKSIYRQFCGGESIEECKQTIQSLSDKNIGSILDYSVEGTEREEDFDSTCDEIMRCIQIASENPAIPFSVFKPSGIASNKLLEKVSRNEELKPEERQRWEKVLVRVDKLCKATSDAGIMIFFDAEETWTQGAVDSLCTEMMLKYNRSRPVVFNTIQLYLKDKLDYLKSCIEDAKEKKYFLGVKLVRGAYMEKERARAKEKGYPSPVQENKAASDKDFDAAIEECLKNLEVLAFCAGTHNEESSYKLAALMAEYKFPVNHPHIHFSQLLGMSDHISYNLSLAGYNVSKYVPYGPVKSVMPYLLRRAQENTSISGQMSKELRLIISEIKRRRKL